MIVRHALSLLLLAWVGPSFLSGPAIAAPVPAADSLDASSAQRSSGSSPSAPAPDSIIVVFESGVEGRYTRVEPKVMGYVTAYPSQGTVEHLSAHRIRSIRSGAKDVTERVLTRGDAFGANRPGSEIESVPKLRGRPLPIKSMFPLIELGVLAPLDADDPSTTVTFELGVMRNQTSHRSLGGSLGFVVRDENIALAAKPRLRLWLGKAYSIDVAPGLFVPVEAQSSRGPIGFLGEVSFVLGDWISLTSLTQIVEVEKTHYQVASPGASTYQDTEVSWHLGAKLGAEATLVTTAVAALAAVVLSVAVHGGGDLE